ncbi:MAG: type II toxin-antitoxin system RelE/ParE family toxin [Prosthecobacter sp.]|nr:type II toxin-antitoxin system RelE/ParE family toxin [Prosthecobacter sp.]
MTIRFVEEAQREFLDAISYYEDARGGLGRRFKDEVDRSVLWIADHPELYRLRPSAYRRINIRVFPYYIPYVVREQTLWVLAVAHGSRKPLYWISRRDDVQS